MEEYQNKQHQTIDELTEKLMVSIDQLSLKHQQQEKKIDQKALSVTIDQMLGPFQLLICLCSLSKILSAKVEIFKKPLPWELRVRQECKEEAQIVCKECGWAQCVPSDAEDTNFDPNYECCPNVRKGHKAYCCPLGYEFKCCAVLPQQKYALKPTHFPETIEEFEKTCKNGKICICGLNSHGLMRGFCCDKSSNCGCCGTDPTISKNPALDHEIAREEASCKAEIIAKVLNTKRAICEWTVMKHSYLNLACCGEDLKFIYETSDYWGRHAYYPTIHSHYDAVWWLYFYCRKKNLPQPCKDDILEKALTGPLDSFAGCDDNVHPASDCCVEHYALSLKWKNDLPSVKDGNVRPKDGQACQKQIDEEARRQHLRAGHCIWAEGWKASKCCHENYKLRIQDDYSYVLKQEYESDSGWHWGLEGKRYIWRNVTTAEMVRALDESSDCKQKEVYCACGTLHFDQIMNGMCCDSDTSCACCSKDSTISKLPEWVRKPRQVQECKDQMLLELGGQEQKTEAFCLWSEGWKDDKSKCCDKDYQLVLMDKRYADYKIRVAETPFAAIRGFDRHHPFCTARRPWIHPKVCAFEWYWVPYLRP
uniref:Uncharacterized protein n=1 Tax=Globodera rostochiensis TaxID=31243 RepID=A0A914HU34_GLORO